MNRSIAATSCAFLIGFGLWVSSPFLVGTTEPWDAEGPYYLAMMLAGGAALGLAFPGQFGPVYLGLWAGQVLALLLPHHDRAWLLLGVITTAIGSLPGLAGYWAAVVANRGWREAGQGEPASPESTGRTTLQPWRNRLRSGVLRVCWLPPALWLASWAYIVLTDRWGAFAAAPLLAASIGLSFVLGMIGGLVFLWTAWRREFDPLLAACSLLAGSVFLLAL